MIENIRLKAALIYKNKFGFSVIPCREDKKPFLPWEEFQKRIATDEEITAWWNKWPIANIGIVTGLISNLAVIDIDDMEIGKAELNKYIPESFVCPTANTPRGGQHLYCLCPDEKIRNNSKVVTGCDLRANGGYVLAPPSSNGKGKQYSWASGLHLKDITLPALPKDYIDFITTNSLNNINIYNTTFEALQSSLSVTFEYGRKDDDLYHVGNAMGKGGLERDSIEKVLLMLMNSWGENDPKWAKEKVDSIMKRIQRRESHVMDDIREWLSVAKGCFSVQDCCLSLQSVAGAVNRSSVRSALCRLVDEGIIERVGNKDSQFRKVENKIELVDWKGSEGKTMDLEFPFDMLNSINIFPGSIILVAGSPNSGKTTFLLNMAKENMDKYKILYMNSEMGGAEFKDRIKLFGDDPESWPLDMVDRSSNYEDLIIPEQYKIFIIDYLEVTKDFAEVGVPLAAIHHKLKDSIAIIGIQKNFGTDFGRGGVFTIEKPRLALAIEKNKIKIVKAKGWRKGVENPNGKYCNFSLVNGSKFIKKGEWTYDTGEFTGRRD